MAKEEIACYEQFLLFPQCFLLILRTFCHFHRTQNCHLQTLSIWRGLEFVIWERVKTRAFTMTSYSPSALWQKPTIQQTFLKFKKELTLQNWVLPTLNTYDQFMCKVLIQLKQNCRRSSRHKINGILHTDGHTDTWTRWFQYNPKTIHFAGRGVCACKITFESVKHTKNTSPSNKIWAQSKSNFSSNNKILDWSELRKLPRT